MIDLTSFADVPKDSYPKRQSSYSQPSQQSNTVDKSRVMKPIDDALIDPEMAESLARESRQPESLKKHLWKPNDFESWAYDEASIAKKRAELGMKDPDEVYKDAQYIK